MFKKISPFRQFGFFLIFLIFVSLAIDVAVTLKVTYSPSIHQPIAIQRLRDFYGDSMSEFNIAFYLTNELIMSPFTPKTLLMFSVGVLALMFVIFVVSIFFLLKHRKQYSLVKNILFVVLIITLLFFWLFGLVFTPIFTEYMLVKLTKSKIESTLADQASLKSVSDTAEITSWLEKTIEPTKVIVGFGVAGNAFPQIANLKAPTYFESFVLPSVLFTYKDTVNFKQNSWNTSPVWYFPEKNVLVINDVTKVQGILQVLSRDLLNDSNLGVLNLPQDSKVSPANIQILKNDEYSSYLIQKVRDLKQEDLATLKEDLANNTLVLDECSKVVSKNEKTYADDSKDYQLNCVEHKNYSNCNEFKDALDIFSKEMNEISLNCDTQSELAIQYNREIRNLMDKVEIDIKGYEDVNSLDRKIAELSAGIFMQPNNIYIRSTEDHAELFRISLHELIHYSVNNDDRTIPAFLDEGLTDFVLNKSLGLDDYYSVITSAYFVETQVVQSLTERIPLEELLPVFKSGDDSKLQELFERYFPGVSYETFIAKGKEIFETSYEVDNKEIIYNTTEFRSYIGLPVVQDMRGFLGINIKRDYAGVRK